MFDSTGGKYIDGFNKEQLKHFDAIILYNYDYYNKGNAYKLLTEYVQDGGKLFIDTGGEIADADSTGLPDLFPIKTSQRKEMQTEWNLNPHDSPLTQDISFTDFGPPVFNGKPWKFSYPISSGDISTDAKVILENQGNPIVAEKSLGNGKVIWSGMNLPYHFNQYHVQEEAKFFKNILQELVGVSEHPIVPVLAKWKSPERIDINWNSQVKGILVKEENYGWSASSATNGLGSLKTYSAGPTYPGFIYVPVNPVQSDSYQMTVTYTGKVIYWVQSAVTILAVLILLELIIFDGKIIGKPTKVLTHKGKKIIHSWWEKEEE
jgi:hypothetical protein